MREFRYDEKARAFDDELEKELSAHVIEKQSEKAESKADNGLARIAQGRTPLDEVRALIDASKNKSAAEEVAEHRVRQKLATLRDAPRVAVDAFLTHAKNNG